ncbi:unnamed protein product [Euphydryas editha]|uniref:Uncharacterized protein n=1 Tax=Euphydryas editha TaxID=104508 RepID=A0AAU9V780_EUPED|nr:unnamed protein product [Euphydryas editha]
MDEVLKALEAIKRIWIIKDKKSEKWEIMKLSMSPENATETNVEKNTQINKKNKTKQIVASAKRSSNFSEGIIKQGILNYVVKNTTNKTNNQNNQA